MKNKKIRLEEMASDIRNYKGITRKHMIKDVVGYFQKAKNPDKNFGEDAAVIMENDRALLLATDGIMESLVRTDPFFAGYAAVLVNVNDIAAMGGYPVAMVDVVSVSSTEVSKELLRGLEAGARKFGVPIVGGHTHPDSNYDAVDIAILGKAEADSILYSHTAKPGDAIIAAVDTRGYLRTKYAWDSTTSLDSNEVQSQINQLPKLASQSLVNSCKDISNPGTAGSLGMLLEASGMGGVLEIEKLPIPKTRMDLSHWLKVYQGYGFVLTAAPENANKIISGFGKVGAKAEVCGFVTDDKKLWLSRGNEKVILFDFCKKGITGIPE